MSNDTLVLLLPAIEACIAAAIALLLYRTSKAFVQADRIGGVPVKTMRVAGSAAIFVIAMMLMVGASPRGHIMIDKSDARELREGAGRIEDAAAALSTCLRRDPQDAGCRQYVDTIGSEARRLKNWTPDDSKLD